MHHGERRFQEKNTEIYKIENILMNQQTCAPLLENLGYYKQKFLEF